MNDLTVVDSIYLDAQQKEDVRRLSSLGYSSKDIAVSLGLSPEDVGLFVRDAETVGTSVNFLIREGILVARAAPEIKLHEAAEGGNVEAIKQLEAVRKRHTFERLIEQMDDDDLIKPSRIDFDKVDINQIQRILSTGTLEALAPDEREYYSLMEMVRGLRARMRINGKLVTKAGIIRLLKSEPYGLSDWMARQVYADSLNFFYTQDNVRPQAFANLYAEKAENWANTVFLMGNVKEAKNLLKLAAELRGCYKDQQTEIPEELLSQKSTVIYTTSRKDLGVPEIDRKELEEFIDAIPEIPVIVRDNIKEDARIKAFDLKKRMLYDIKEFGEDNEGE